MLLGEHNTETKLESATFKTRAKLYGYHKHWSYRLEEDKGSLIYDMALLELAERVDWARYPHIRPVCLPLAGDIDYDGEVATLVGWGSNLIYYETLQDRLVKGVPSESFSQSLQKLDIR